MTRRRTASSPATPREWIGGLASLPTHVTGDGETFRPDLLLWLGGDGLVRGTELARPGEALPRASASLQRAIDQPLGGDPEAPSRVRVASKELADSLRAGHPALEVVVAPTPELDVVLETFFEEMAEKMAGEKSEEMAAPDAETCLPPGVAPDAMGAFFAAAAALYRAEPWERVVDDSLVFAVTIEAQNVHEAVLSVIGHLGQNRGLVLFGSLEDFDAYLDAGDLVAMGETADIPPHLAITYSGRDEVPPPVRAEIAEHGWEVAAPDAYPQLIAVDADLVSRPPEAWELRFAEAVARCFAELAETEPALLEEAGTAAEPVVRTRTVTTGTGELEVRVQAPHPDAIVPAQVVETSDLLAALAELERDDEIDSRRRFELEDALLRHFDAAPESETLSEGHCLGALLDLGADYLGHTVASLGPEDLEELVFELVPRKFTMAPDEAPWIIDGLRAFYRFLDREFGLQQADACLRLLGGDAVERLRTALSNPDNFGWAKSFAMAGARAGFDTSTEEGLAAWVAASDGQLAFPEPTAGTSRKNAATKDRKKEKRKRKAARKARKRSR